MEVWSGSSVSKHYENLVEFTINWQITRDLVNKKYKYKADLYMDATKCLYIETIDVVGSHSTLSIVDPRNSTEDHLNSFAATEFYMPQFTILSDKSNRKLASIETEYFSVADEMEPFPVSIVATLHFYGKWKIHLKDLTRTITTKERDLVSVSLTVNPIAPYTLAGVDGTGVLDSEHALLINAGEEEYTHTVEYDDASGNVFELCNKSRELSVPFMADLELAALNPEGTTVTIPFRIYSYYGDTLVYTRGAEFTFAIPETVRPTCNIHVQDGEMRDGQTISSIYNGFVQHHSRYKVKVNPSLAYGSEIAEYNITIDGVNYKGTDAEITTELIKTSGSQTISASVTDRRGRTSDTKQITFDVIPYTSPYISALRAKRCNQDGTENPIGDFMKVVFSASVSPLNGKNSVTYVLHQSKATGTDAKDEVLAGYTGQHAIENGMYIFEANRGYAYIIELRVIDDFETKKRQTGGGLAAILMNWLASGKGLCFGGLASKEDTFECKFKFYPSGGYTHPAYTYNNLYIKEPNTYFVENPTNILDCPTTDPFVFEIIPISADGLDIMQRITTCPQGAAPVILVRVLRKSSWGSWYNMTTGQAL